jgi:hypothetical protein
MEAYLPYKPIECFHMKLFGALLFALGIIISVFGMNMDTTVETGGQTIGSGDYSVTVPNSRVHNIGLIHKREMIFYGAGMSLLLGAIFIGFGTLSANRPQGQNAASSSQQPSIEANNDSKKSSLHFISAYVNSLKVGILMIFKSR